MTALLRKEARSQAPFLWLVLFLVGLSAVYEMSSHRPDERPLAATFDDYFRSEPGEELLYLLLVFAMCSGLLVREHDDRTMEYLDSLPVSRTGVFAAKFAVAFLILSVLAVASLGQVFILHAISRDSLDPSLHWGIHSTALGLQLCQNFVLMSLAILLSFLRRLGWVLGGVIFWMYLLAEEAMPSLAALNPFSLLEPVFVGQRWVTPRSALLIQLALGSACLLSAYCLFLGAGDRLVRLRESLGRSRRGALLLGLGGAAVVAVWLSMAAWLGYREHGEQPSDPPVYYPEWGTARETTERYAFTYPRNLETRARQLIQEADRASEAVRAFLGAEGGHRIQADLAGGLERHAGMAYWKTLRMDLGASEDLRYLLGVLGHETAHVYADLLSDSRLVDAFNSTRFFVEGLATYLEYRLFRGPDDLASLRSVAAVIRARDEVDFEELADDPRFSRKRDPDLVYPLGEVFVAALVERYGDQAPGGLLRRFAEEEGLKGLEGTRLWRAAFQAAGYNLDRTIDDFHARLDEEVGRHQPLIRLLPRLGGAVEVGAEWVMVWALRDAPQGFRAVCRFRRSADEPSTRYIVAFPDGSQFTVQRGEFPAASFWYQLGLVDDASERAIYEPWVEIRLDR